MTPMDKIPPAVLLRSELGVLLAISEFGLYRNRWIPNRFSENATKPCDSSSVRQDNDAPIDIAFGQLTFPYVRPICLGVSIVVAMDEPDSFTNGFQFDVQRPLRLQVTPN